jgi:hypothetical protein
MKGYTNGLILSRRKLARFKDPTRLPHSRIQQTCLVLFSCEVFISFNRRVITRRDG